MNVKSGNVIVWTVGGISFDRNICMGLFTLFRYFIYSDHSGTSFLISSRFLLRYRIKNVHEHFLTYENNPLILATYHNLNSLPQITSGRQYRLCIEKKDKYSFTKDSNRQPVWLASNIIKTIISVVNSPSHLYAVAPLRNSSTVLRISVYSAVTIITLVLKQFREKSTIGPIIVFSVL